MKLFSTPIEPLLFIVVALLALGCVNAKTNELKSNKTPKAANLFTDTCDECQTIITRLVAVAKDPAKVAELKLLLSVLCRETSYEEECRLFVSKIDLFLEKLLPYLRDPHRVCEFLHLCSNAKLSQFHRVGMLYARKYTRVEDGAKDLICEECQFAAHELQEVVDRPETQAEVKQWLSDNVCAHMGQERGACDMVLEEFLPELWQELHSLLQDNKQFCVDIELCDPSQLAAVGRALITPSANSTSNKVSHRLMATLFN